LWLMDLDWIRRVMSRPGPSPAVPGVMSPIPCCCAPQKTTQLQFSANLSRRRLYSASIRDARTASRSPWLETVLVMKTAENRSGDDTVALATPMAAQHRRDVGAVGNARPKARVWTPAIEMRDPLPEDLAEVTLV
jgi:hypothetical protein